MMMMTRLLHWPLSMPDPLPFRGRQRPQQPPPAALILLVMEQLPSHLREIHHQHMVRPKLKLAMVLLQLLLHMGHPLVTVPPPQKLDPLELTLGLEPLALMEDTKSPLLQRHYLQPQQGARHSTADTLALLLNQHPLSYRKGGSVARTALTVEV